MAHLADRSQTAVQGQPKLISWTIEKMGSIVERKRADGTVACRVQILIKAKRRIVHQESSTFDQRSTAQARLKRREKELHALGGM